MLYSPDMTLKQFFTGRAAVFGLLLIILLGVYGYKAFAPTPIEDSGTRAEISAFVWEYKSAVTLNPDGIPETEIYLDARYVNGKAQKKLIDTVPSTCSELPDAENDSAVGTTTIQCYGAGLGFKFKITKGQNSYQVQRQMFEEASPDHNPPTYEYVVVAEFPLAAAN